MALPTIQITDVPPGNVCPFRFQRTGKGTRKFNAGGSYACQPFKTVRVVTTLHFDLVAPASTSGCDETGPLFPGTLTLDVTNGTTVYREDRFGIFFGSCTISAAGSPLFRGRIELYERVTVQQAPLVTAGTPCDLKCQPENRLEGWLVAGGTVPSTEKLTIRAQVGAKGTVPALGQAASLSVQNVVITGVVVRA